MNSDSHFQLNTCAWCNSPKQHGLVCPDCGADYAKAEAIKSKGKAEPIVVTAVNNTEESFFEINDPVIPVKDPGFEKIVCLTALPAMLVIAMLAQITGFLAGMQRIVFGMPVNEMGHAVTGWLCGFNSIPSLWVTVSSGERGYISSIAVLVALLMLARYALVNKKPVWLIPAAVIFLLQLYGTLIISGNTADMLITVGGDAMGLILATLLIVIFYLGKDTQLYKGSLRWGFLAIGAAAFMDIFAPWYNKDISAIGYGMTGNIHTDSFKMINVHLWQWDSLFTLHNTIGYSCLLVVLCAYCLGIKQANQWVKERARQDRLKSIRNN